MNFRNRHFEKLHVPRTISDRVAKSLSVLLRCVADLFFQECYTHRAVILETVAAVPGMVAGMLIHLRCLRTQSPDNGWIKTLLAEAENERMHLMVFVEIAKLRWFERVLIIIMQGFFFSTFLVLYLISAKTAHRLVGYFEEEAIISYTRFLEEIDKGNITNIAAPKIAIEYWNLSPEADLREVVMAACADEAKHRDNNHNFADILSK